MPTISDSDNLSAAEWADGVLSIDFKKGLSYQFYDVPIGLYHELLAAPSKNTFFVQNIKGKFTYARV